MRRILARALLAISALSALAVGAGISVAPHDDAPGTPPAHDHALAAYRFAFLPTPEAPPASEHPAMASLSQTLAKAGVPMSAVEQMPGMSRPHPETPTSFAISGVGITPIEDLAIAFGLLVALVARLPRPDRRAVAELTLPLVRASQWRLTLPLAPPRPPVLSTGSR